MYSELLKQVGYEDEVDEDGWEYVEEGPPEIIWQGNEIIVKKKKVRVKKNNTDLQIAKEVFDTFLHSILQNFDVFSPIKWTNI